MHGRHSVTSRPTRDKLGGSRDEIALLFGRALGARRGLFSGVTMSTGASNHLAAGTRVGNYVLQERIGQGAFAQVWKAVHHERPGRVVAVKIPTEPNYRKQLAREGRLPGGLASVTGTVSFARKNVPWISKLAVRSAPEFTGSQSKGLVDRRGADVAECSS